MDFKKHALILGVIEELNQHGSRTGKTHVQKALALLDAKAEIPVPFQFVLYKHGPYSFDVEDELEQMTGYMAIISDPVPDYGVTLHASKMADFIKRTSPLSDMEKRAIERVCTFIGDKNVIELERIATAAWIRTREQVQDTNGVAVRLHQLKPHVSLEDATDADQKVTVLLNAA